MPTLAALNNLRTFFAPCVLVLYLPCTYTLVILDNSFEIFLLCVVLVLLAQWGKMLLMGTLSQEHNNMHLVILYSALISRS